MSFSKIIRLKKKPGHDFLLINIYLTNEILKATEKLSPENE